MSPRPRLGHRTYRPRAAGVVCALALTTSTAGVVALPVLTAPAFAKTTIAADLPSLQAALGPGCTAGDDVQLIADVVSPAATVASNCAGVTLTLAAADTLTLKSIVIKPGAGLTITGASTDVLTVDASADDNAAGIENTGASLSLQGLEVVATGGHLGAGIGGGSQGEPGPIVIGGTANVAVLADASAQGAAIGGGYLADGGMTTIEGDAQVTVTTRTSAGGAAIGGGYAGDGGTIDIRGQARVYATARSGANGAAIGGGFQGDGGSVTIEDDARVVATARSGAKGAAIGGGYQGNGGEVRVADQADVTATTSVSGDIMGAAIGGGPGGDGADVLIDGGTVTASATDQGAPIGPGSPIAGEPLAFGTLSVEGTLRLPSGVLDVSDTPGLSEMVVGGRVTGSVDKSSYATITGDGQIVNDGAIAFPGASVTATYIYGRDYRILFNTRGTTRAPSSAAPKPARVFATSFADGGRGFPSKPQRPGFRFLGWNTHTNGHGTTVSASSTLPGSSIDGAPQLITAFAIWKRR